MSENLTNSNKETIVVVQQPPSAAIGICALIFAIISIFFLALFFVPLSLILSIVAIVKKQYVWAVCAIIVAIISAFMSPTLWPFFAAFF
jgi:hypothetical protein